MAKYNGSGWHFQSKRHSNAKKTGHAGGTYKSVIYPAQFRDKEGKNVSFNLYEMEDINFEDSKRNILNNFLKNHKKELDKIYTDAGLAIQDIKYYSPNAYNYQGDSIDIKARIKNEKKLLTFIEKNKTELQKLLDANKSYDGYMALTKSNVEEVVEEIKEDKEVDPMVIQLLNNKITLDYEDDFYSRMEFEPEEGAD